MNFKHLTWSLILGAILSGARLASADRGQDTDDSNARRTLVALAKSGCIARNECPILTELLSGNLTLEAMTPAEKEALNSEIAAATKNVKTAGGGHGHSVI